MKAITADAWAGTVPERPVEKSDDMIKSAQVPRLHRQTLIAMNVAAFTARRDAALARVVSVLRNEVAVSPKDHRQCLYEYCLQLLDDAILSTRRSQAQQDTPLLHCLHLLRDTVAASFALVHHELTLVREAEQFARVLGPDMIAELQTEDDVFSSSEMNILDCVDNLLAMGETVRKRDTDKRKAKFSEEDRRRYDLSQKEYTSFYAVRQPSPRFPTVDEAPGAASQPE